MTIKEVKEHYKGQYVECEIYTTSHHKKII